MVYLIIWYLNACSYTVLSSHSQSTFVCLAYILTYRHTYIHKIYFLVTHISLLKAWLAWLMDRERERVAERDRERECVCVAERERERERER